MSTKEIIRFTHASYYVEGDDQTRFNNPNLIKDLASKESIKRTMDMAYLRLDGTNSMLGVDSKNTSKTNDDVTLGNINSLMEWSQD